MIMTHRRNTRPSTRAMARGAVLLGAAGCGVVLTACDVHLSSTITGSGVSSRESREVSTFRRVEVDGALEVRVDVGSGPSLWIEGDDNLLSYVETENRGDLLLIRVSDGVRLDPPPRVELSTVALDALDLAGSGEVLLRGAAGDRLALKLTGSGDLEATGTVTQLELEVTGSGDVHLEGLSADRISVAKTGSGNARVRANAALVVDQAGSGDLLYAGTPEVTVRSSSGSGTVRRAEPRE